MQQHMSVLSTCLSLHSLSLDVLCESSAVFLLYTVYDVVALVLQLVHHFTQLFTLCALIVCHKSLLT